MHRKTVHRWTAALALVAVLGVIGARPAAAADLSDLRVADRLASLWSAVSERPVALWDTLIGRLGGNEKPSPQKNGWGIDPLGDQPSPPPPSLSEAQSEPADGSK